MRRKQKVCRVGDLLIGGSPGELPTVLMGNIFYKGMPEVSNHRDGSFHHQEVSKLIETTSHLSKMTGVPHILDVMAMHPKAMNKYIAYVSEQTDAPFLIDGANSETREAGLKTCRELGLQTRVIYNGISPRTTQTELEAIADSGVDRAILMAYNELDYLPEGRLTILKGSPENASLLNMASKANVTEMLVDTIVFDIPSISYAAEAIKLVKADLGFPTGCSPANATYSWKRLKKDAISAQGFAASNASAHTFAQLWGADFLIYGPVKQAKHVIPAIGMTDAIIAYYAMKRFGTKPKVPSHPLKRIL